MFIKNSSLDKVDNDLLIISYSSLDNIYLTYNDGSFNIDKNELIVEDYENYNHNRGTNLELENLISIYYKNKDNNEFIYYYE